MNPFYTVVALDGGRVGVDDSCRLLTALERADQNGQLAVVEQWAAWVPATERGGRRGPAQTRILGWSAMSASPTGASSPPDRTAHR
ncbi:MAG: hypothetical protein R2882_15305 [Gemmatimonadales bacterium]